MPYTHAAWLEFRPINDSHRANIPITALLKKTGCFFNVILFKSVALEPLGDRIFNRISQHGSGWVFCPDEFHDLGDPRFVGMALTRLVSSGKIRRLARGLYDFPKSHPVRGTMAPSPDAIAMALAGRHSIRLIPSGAYAANLLGLSDQRLTKSVFLTDGPSRTVRIGNQEIHLKQTTPRNMGPAGRKSGLVIQAIRYMGQHHVNTAIIKKMKRKLSANDKKQLLDDLGFAPAWVRTHLRAIAKGAC